MNISCRVILFGALWSVSSCALSETELCPNAQCEGVSAPVEVRLLSEATSASASPLFRVDFDQNQGSDVAGVQYRIVSELGTVVSDWQNGEVGSVLRAHPVSLENGTTYRVEARGVDAGDFPGDHIASEAWIVQVVAMPSFLRLDDIETIETDIDWNGESITFSGTSMAARDVSVAGNNQVDPAEATALLLRAKSVNFAIGTKIDAGGENGSSGQSNVGGRGGSGGGAGGVGGGSTSCTNGGSGGGAGASGGVSGSCGPSAGAGTAGDYALGYPWPLGGNGGAGGESTNADPEGPLGPQGLRGLGGVAGPGSGGGGGGAGSGSTSGHSAGAGGGGGGLIAIVAKSITGAGTLSARGGNGGDRVTLGGSGGGGGGGVVWIAAESFSADLTIDVDGGDAGVGALAGEGGLPGSVFLFEILSDGSLAQRVVGDSW